MSERDRPAIQIVEEMLAAWDNPMSPASFKTYRELAAEIIRSVEGGEK